jgi:hypothetical protein
MNKMNLKIGDYLICRYKGESGDLIAGRVTHIHRDGKITSANLLSKGESTRHVDVLYRRNLVVSRSAAMQVVDAYGKDEDKQRARAKAVELATAVVAAASKSAEKADKPVKRGPGRPPKNGNGNGDTKAHKKAKSVTRKAKPAGGLVHNFGLDKAKDQKVVVTWLTHALKTLQAQA